MPPKKSKSIHEIADALGQGMPFSPATAEVAGAVGFDTEHENQVDRLDGAAPFDDYDYTEQEWGVHQNYRWPHDPGSVSLADLPPEVLANIQPHLNPREIVRMSRTNRNLHDLYSVNNAGTIEAMIATPLNLQRTLRLREALRKKRFYHKPHIWYSKFNSFNVPAPGAVPNNFPHNYDAPQKFKLTQARRNRMQQTDLEDLLHGNPKFFQANQSPLYVGQNGMPLLLPEMDAKGNPIVKSPHARAHLDKYEMKNYSGGSTTSDFDQAADQPGASWLNTIKYV